MVKAKKSFKKFFHKNKLEPLLKNRKEVQKITRQRDKRHRKFVDALDKAKQKEIISNLKNNQIPSYYHFKTEANQIAKEKDLFNESEKYTQLIEDKEISSDEMDDDISIEEDDKIEEESKEDVESIKINYIQNKFRQWILWKSIRKT